MNDAAAATDVDSFSSDSESCPKLSKPPTYTSQPTNFARQSNITAQLNPYSSRPLSMKKTTPQEKGTINTFDGILLVEKFFLKGFLCPFFCQFERQH